MSLSPSPTALEHLKWWRDRLPEPSFVYVVQGKPGTPIKVGKANNPEQRLRELQTGNPDRLTLLYVVPGDRKLETSFHRRLKESNVTGEWFGGEGAEEFLAWIDDYSTKAITTFAEKGVLPAAPPPPKLLNRRGFGAFGTKTSRLGHRWRTMDKPEANPVVVKFVKPDPKMDPEIARRVRSGKARFSGYELERMAEEEAKRKAA